MSEVDEIRRSINWLYTAVGSFTFYISFLANYRISREDLCIDFPLLGKLSYMATLVFGIPVLTIATLFIFYLCFNFLLTIEVKPSSYTHYIPAPFNLYLDSKLKELRYLFFFLFTIFPTLVSVVLFQHLFDRVDILNTENSEHFSRWRIFILQAEWCDGAKWRWVHDQNPELLSAYPGIQPILYLLLILSCFVFIIGLISKIILMNKK